MPIYSWVDPPEDISLAKFLDRVADAIDGRNEFALEAVAKEARSRADRLWEKREQSKREIEGFSE